MHKYIIITPSKNEKENIHKLMETIAKQTIKPMLWVFVDESDDGTEAVIKETTEKHGWIKAIFLEKKDGYLGANYGLACKIGFEYAISYCMQYGIEYDYIGLIDADVIINSDFFEKLMMEFEKDLELGIASGSDSLAVSTWVENFPIGPVKLWRKKCFEETGGYQATPAVDSVSNIKAKLTGWKIKRFKEMGVIVRGHASAQGYWKGYVRIGKDAHFLDYALPIIVLKSIKYSFTKSHYIGIAILYGYLGSVIHREEKIDDKQIRNYFRYTRPKEIFRQSTHIPKVVRNIFRGFT